MTDLDLRIDAYLDALARELRVDPAHARRILLEVDDHLRESVRAAGERGATEDAAVHEALAAFGTPRTVARRFHAESGQRLTRALLLQLVLSLGLLAGVGLTAIGASGVLAAGMGAAFGKSFVAGDAAGITYTPQRCAQYLQYDTRASSCTQAALDDHFAEIVYYRLAVGALGLMALGACWLLRRRFRQILHAAPLPRLIGDTAGAALFGVAGLLLLVDGGLGASANGSQGGQLSGGIVAALLALWFCRGLWRTLLQSPRA